MRMSTRTRLGVSAALVAALFFALPAAARTSFVTPGGGQSVGPMQPGDTVATTYEVRNQYTLAGRLKLTARAVVDEERGCLEPEINEGRDATCGEHEGELGDWLRLSVESADAGLGTIWTGSLKDLSTGVVVDRMIPASAAWRVNFVSHLPVEAPNAVMTDAIRYDLEWEITAGSTPDVPTIVVPTDGPSEEPTNQPTTEPSDKPTEQPTDQPTVAPTEATATPTAGPTDDGKDEDEVAGVEAERPRPPTGPGLIGGLPATGTQVSLLLLLLTAGLLTGGSILLAANRRRTRG